MTAEVVQQGRVRLANGKEFAAPAGVSILEAAAQAGLALEHSCRTGRCGLCKATVVSGRTRILRAEEGLTAAEAAEGAILTCCRAAESPVALELEDLGPLADLKARTLPCRIAALTVVAPEVVAVTLRLPPSEALRYLPGQYLNLIVQGQQRSYSIANAPRPDGHLELLIRRVPGGTLSGYWFGGARVNDLLRLSGPHGTFFLRPPLGPQLFLATGTGIAPIRALLQSLATSAASTEVRVYWGNRTPEEFFWSPHEALASVDYRAVLSRPGPDWRGARGRVQDVLVAEGADFAHARVYASGSNGMIHDARALLARHGLAPRAFHADPFLDSGSNTDNLRPP